MNRTMITLATVLILPGLALAVDCEAQLEWHLASDLDLSYEEFDQTMDSGMRRLSAKGCHSETADLIGAYVEHNHAKQSSLRWHIAQDRAFAGEYEAAIASARSVLTEDEDLEQNPFRWNDYVLATIAFLEQDRKSLIQHRDNVAQGAELHHGNAINLKLLDRLIDNFGKNYAEATR